MGISRTEVNLRRLLAAAPKQENQAKLAHYVATLREQLEQLAEERTPDGLPRVPKAMVIDYSEKIEAIAAKLSAPLHDVQELQEPFPGNSSGESPHKELEDPVTPKSGLRRRFAPTSSTADTTQPRNEVDTSGPVKLDAAAQVHIEKHRFPSPTPDYGGTVLENRTLLVGKKLGCYLSLSRELKKTKFPLRLECEGSKSLVRKLQEDLTDEMVGLARQLKESSLVMSQSLQNTEKILDSTEKAVEHSLASTNRVNVRATQIYSESSKTTCFTWLLIFAMTCIFIMVVLLIRVT